MNKTLLLILCDFLLLTILSMWKSEKEAPPPSEDAAQQQDQQGVAAMAMMEQDLLDTLRYSLEEEQDEQSQLSQNLAERQAELERKQQEIAERENRIQNLEETLTDAEKRERALAAERAKLEEQVEAVRTDYSQVTQRLQETESEALQSQAQSRRLQEELQQRLKEIEAKEAALAAASEKLSTAQEQVQELDLKVKMSEQEKSFLRQSVEGLQGEIVAERSERQRLQEQAGVLAQGVTQLAESSQDLREELRSNFEINANQIFSNFNDNRVTARFSAVKYSRNRFVDTEQATSTVLVSDGERSYALMHVEGGPFTLKSNAALIRNIDLTLTRRGSTVSPSKMEFLALDPRVVLIPLTNEQAETLGSKPYVTALNPFKFPEAVLVNQQGNYYGEVEFKLDAETPGFVKMQTKIFNAIFGEFSPSVGDLVFSKTGELLGVMVNKRYCALVDNFVVAGSYDVQGEVNRAKLDSLLAKLNGMVSAFPNPLR